MQSKIEKSILHERKSRARCRRRQAREGMQSKMQERICKARDAGESSACPCCAYSLLNVFSCLLSSYFFFLASRWDGAYSARMRPSAGIGEVEVQKTRVFWRFLRCAGDPLRVRSTEYIVQISTEYAAQSTQCAETHAHTRKYTLSHARSH